MLHGRNNLSEVQFNVFPIWIVSLNHSPFVCVKDIISTSDENSNSAIVVVNALREETYQHAKRGLSSASVTVDSAPCHG